MTEIISLGLDCFGGAQNTLNAIALHIATALYFHADARLYRNLKPIQAPLLVYESYGMMGLSKARLPRHFLDSLAKLESRSWATFHVTWKGERAIRFEGGGEIE